MTTPHYSRTKAREAILADAATRLVEEYARRKGISPRAALRAVIPSDSDHKDRLAREETASIAAEIGRRLDLRNGGG